MHNVVLRTHPADEEICRLDTSHCFAKHEIVHVHFGQDDVRTYQVIEAHVDVKAGGGMLCPIVVYLAPVDITAHFCAGKHVEPTPAEAQDASADKKNKKR